MPVTFSRPHDPPQLVEELATAGIPTNGLWSVGTISGTIGTYDAQGQQIDLPPEAQPVVDAHVSQEHLEALGIAEDTQSLKGTYHQQQQRIQQGRQALMANDDAGWAALPAAQKIDRLRETLLGQLAIDVDVLKALRSAMR